MHETSLIIKIRNIGIIVGVIALAIYMVVRGFMFLAETNREVTHETFRANIEACEVGIKLTNDPKISQEVFDEMEYDCKQAMWYFRSTRNYTVAGKNPEMQKDRHHFITNVWPKFNANRMGND